MAGNRLWYTVRIMNPKLTPELRAALSQHPVGPIQFEDETAAEPVYLVRLADIPSLQSLVDDRIRQKLAEADAAIAAGDVAELDVEDIKRRGRTRMQHAEKT